MASHGTIPLEHASQQLCPSNPSKVDPPTEKELQKKTKLIFEIKPQNLGKERDLYIAERSLALVKKLISKSGVSLLVKPLAAICSSMARRILFLSKSEISTLSMPLF